jgi:hypothetical protein
LLAVERKGETGATCRRQHGWQEPRADLRIGVFRAILKSLAGSESGVPAVAPGEIQTPNLSFWRNGLLSFHADLRVSLRKVRARQRNPRPLQRLEGRGMPAVRLKEIVQEIFHIRFGECWFHWCEIVWQ